jgi:hypothetical protein
MKKANRLPLQAIEFGMLVFGKLANGDKKSPQNKSFAGFGEG